MGGQGDEEEDGGWARSVYDDSPDGPAAPSGPSASRAGIGTLAKWVRVERAAAKELADAAEAVGRVMGSLRHASDRDVLKRRLAIDEASSEMEWVRERKAAAGVRLELAGVGGSGLGSEGAICLRNHRLFVDDAGASEREATPALVEAVDARHGYTGGVAELNGLFVTRDEWTSSIERWTAEMAIFETEVHHLTRAFAIFMTWPSGRLGEELACLEALGVACRSARWECRELGFLPVARAGARSRPLTRRRDVETAFELWLRWVRASALETELQIGALRSWRERVAGDYATQDGRRAQDTVLQMAEFAIGAVCFTSAMAAKALGCSQSMARKAAAELHSAGLLVNDERSARGRLWRIKA